MNRDHVVSVRLTGDEHDQLKRLAERMGMNLPTYLRRQALSAERLPDVMRTNFAAVTYTPARYVIYNSGAAQPWTW